MSDHVGGYGDETYTNRAELRQVVWEIAGGRCEHPGCTTPGVELAHIVPRGMGHTGYRDTVNNTMCACYLHARSTDNLGDAEWEQIPPPHDRIALSEWVRTKRLLEGWAL